MLAKYILCYKNFLKIKTYKETEIKTKEHNNRQNVNVCNRKLDTSKEREKTIEHF